MTEAKPELDLPALRSVIAAHFPEHREGRYKLLTTGWASVAVDVDDALIFRFPRNETAAQALKMEAGLLALVRPAVTLPVPDLVLVPGPPTFSRHSKLAGEHLLSTDYAQLPEAARDGLAADLALFYAELHALPAAAMSAVGAGPIPPWLPPDEILRRVWPMLSAPLRAFAERSIGAWRAMPPDPYGTVFGFFDGHGWNMAFDHQRERLNGVYDFGDAGFGPLQQEFIYTNWIGRDLTARLVPAYERLTRRQLDRERIDVLSAVLRLTELAQHADDPARDAMVQTVADWAAG